MKSLFNLFIHCVTRGSNKSISASYDTSYMSVARSVRAYLSRRPYVISALEKDIVNQSSLSRKISDEMQIGSLSAVKAAVRRFAEGARENKGMREERVLQILRQSSVAFQDGLNVLVSSEPVDGPSLIDVNLPDVSVHLVDKRASFDDSRPEATHEDCAVFMITSPRLIEETPGVVAYLTSLLAEQDINVIEFVSCFTKTIMVIARRDVPRAYDILRSVVG